MPREGAAAERSKTIGQQDIALFTELTGDRNPLHFDEDMARESLFGGLIVQGGVTSGILSALVAEDLPGPGSVFLDVEWQFVKAVYVGDTITGRVEVTHVRQDKPICKLTTVVRNHKGETACVAPPPRTPLRCAFGARASEQSPRCAYSLAVLTVLPIGALASCGAPSCTQQSRW
jgi:acyl dehydratase